MHNDFIYLMENILTDGHCLLPNAVLPWKFDGLNFDGLAGKCKNIKISAIPYLMVLRIVHRIWSI